MDYDAQLTQFCNPVLAAQVEQFDTQGFPDDPFASALDTGGGPVCAEAIVKYLTPRTGRHFSIRASQIYLGGVSNYLPNPTEPVRADVVEAIKRLPYSKEIAADMFTALRVQRIDIRDHFDGKILLKLLRN